MHEDFGGTRASYSAEFQHTDIEPTQACTIAAKRVTRTLRRSEDESQGNQGHPPGLARTPASIGAADTEAVHGTASSGVEKASLTPPRQVRPSGVEYAQTPPVRQVRPSGVLCAQATPQPIGSPFSAHAAPSTARLASVCAAHPLRHTPIQHSASDISRASSIRHCAGSRFVCFLFVRAFGSASF